MIRGRRVGVLLVGAMLAALGGTACLAEPGVRQLDTLPVSTPVSTYVPSQQAVRRLDLRAPDVTKIYSAQQLRSLLMQASGAELEEVQVRRPYTQPATPAVWRGIAAPFWAVLHPLQAWRILAPLPPEQTAGLQYQALDATSGYLVPAAAPRY